MEIGVEEYSLIAHLKWAHIEKCKHCFDFFPFNAWMERIEMRWICRHFVGFLLLRLFQWPQLTGLTKHITNRSFHFMACEFVYTTWMPKRCVWCLHVVSCVLLTYHTQVNAVPVCMCTPTHRWVRRTNCQRVVCRAIDTTRLQNSWEPPIRLCATHKPNHSH